MKISMKTLAAGPTGVLRPGGVYDLPEEEARQLIEGRYAVPVSEDVEVPKVESRLDGDEDDEPSDLEENRSPAGKAGDAAFEATIAAGGSVADATLAAMKAAAAVPGSEFVAPEEPAATPEPAAVPTPEPNVDVDPVSEPPAN